LKERKMSTVTGYKVMNKEKLSKNCAFSKKKNDEENTVVQNLMEKTDERKHQ